MSELMDRAVIGMPFDMAMQNHLSRMQFYNRAKAILAERDALLAERDALQGQLDDLRNGWANSVKAHSEALAERDAAFAAGQEEMRERAAEWCNGTAMTIPYGRHEPTHDVYAADEPAEWGSHQGMGYAIGIRNLPIKPRP